MALDDDDKKYIKEQLAEARRILREDKILSKLNRHFPDEPATDEGEEGEGEGDDKPKPPKKKEPVQPPKRRDAWWGDALDESQ